MADDVRNLEPFLIKRHDLKRQARRARPDELAGWYVDIESVWHKH